MFRKKFRRRQILEFFTAQRPAWWRWTCGCITRIRRQLSVCRGNKRLDFPSPDAINGKAASQVGRNYAAVVPAAGKSVAAAAVAGRSAAAEAAADGLLRRRRWPIGLLRRVALLQLLLGLLWFRHHGGARPGTRP